MNRGWLNLGALVAILVVPAYSAAAESFSLAGQWRFALDREDRGEREGWFRRKFQETIRLPGSLQAQGFGDPVTVATKWTGQIVDRSWFTDPRYAPYRAPGKVKVPFWLQPERHYVGAAWYQRDVAIPRGWAGKRVVLFLERAHWQTTLWLDNERVGSCDSLATPHQYDLSDLAKPGPHRLTIRVDNRMIVPVGSNAHSVSDHTQTNWNGIIGTIALIATSPVWIDDLQAYPDLPGRQFRLTVRFGNRSDRSGSGLLRVSTEVVGAGAQPVTAEHRLNWGTEGGGAEIDCSPGPKPTAWDEFSPALFRIRADLIQNGKVLHTKTVTAGLRALGRKGTQITVNGRPVFLRGTLECCIFPLTGYPPTDPLAWKRILRIARAHGLNHLRFHSWCPPEAAFQAADALGFYLYVECPLWANGDSSIGDGGPVDRWLYAEGDRILKAYGNHPSFVMMSYGNEPGGKNQNRFLGDLVTYWKKRDPRRLYTSAAGWPMLPENDFHVTPTPRIQAWGQGLTSRINSRASETVTDYREFVEKAGAPVVSHEIGQWCVFPKLAEVTKYRGAVKARNFEIFRDTLRARGMLRQAGAFLMASGKLQAICYKEEIESALRTPGMAGFELLDLHDFPGQGTALVGVLDPFWDSKGYVSPAQFHRFCGETTPLARIPKRVLESSDTFTATLEVAHFGPRDLDDRAAWRIRDESGTVVASGETAKRRISTGNLTALGSVRLPLTSFQRPQKLNLEVSLVSAGFANDWDFWVYPPDPAPESAPGVTVAAALDASAVSALRAGGKVLLLPPPATIMGDEKGRVALGFSPIFWNTAWTGRQAPHTLGVLCDPSHPALAGFPTEFHSNWQWQELLSRAAPFVLNDAPSGLRPIVQVIDDWVTNRRLALVFEARVGTGRLLACGIDLQSDLETRPVARQLRRSLLAYMGGQSFTPQADLDVAAVRSLLKEPSAMHRFGARVVGADSEAEGFAAAQLLDGDPATFWHTAYERTAPGFPHEVVIAFRQEASFSGLFLTQRGDGNPNGWLRDCALYVSSDGREWGDPVARFTLREGPGVQEVQLPVPARGGFLKLTALSACNPKQPFAALAELDLICEPAK